MGKFKQFLLEKFGSLNVTELTREGKTWRIQLFVDKIKSQEPFILNNGNSVVLKNDPKIIKALENNTKGFGGSSKPKYVFKDIYGNTYKLNEFQKTKEFGGGCSGGSGSSSETKTTLQEVGVLVWLDTLIQVKKNLMNYTPSSRMSVTANINDVVNFLRENESWNKSTKASARTILSKFPEVKSGYTFHHDDDIFKKIRQTGKKLSMLSTADKWNPSDIYLIKNVDVEFNDIFSYNNFVSDPSNMIGISLKKGEKTAMHGSFSLKNLSSKFGIDFRKNTFSSVNDAKPTIKKYFKSMKNKNYYVKIDDINLDNAIENLKSKSENFLTSIIPILNFFDIVDTDKVDELLKFAILTAMSISPTSCPHWKLEGSKLSKVPSKDKNIEIGKIILPLDGTANALIQFKFNEKQMICSLRSKGSQPQFNILKSKFNGNVKNINSI